MTEVGGNLVAVMDVPREHTNRYGMLDVAASDGRLVEVKGLVEKPKPEVAPSTLSIIGRYILQPEVFDLIADQEPGAGGEIQLTDAMARMIGHGPFHGYRFEGKRFDCGDKAGFIEANIAYALDSMQAIGGKVRDIAARRYRRDDMRPPAIATDQQGEIRHADRDDRHRLCRPGVRRLLLRVRRRRRLRRQGRRQDRPPAAPARCRSIEPGPRRAGARTTSRPGGSPSSTDLARRCGRRRGVHRRRHAEPRAATAMPISPMSMPPPRRSPRPSTGYTVVVTKSTVPVGTGREVAAHHPRDPPGRRVRRRLQSGVPARRLGDQRFHAARPGRHRHRQRARARGDAPALPAALPDRDADRLHRARDRRADQVCRQRLPRHQDHLHQRDRRSLREGRRRRP